MSALSEIVVIAGPNGAGKTTFARGLIAVAPEFAFINADEIAKENHQNEVRAGRTMLERIEAHVELKKNIMFETTLASRSFAVKIPSWQASGYEISLYYLRLSDPSIAIERVRQRVADGGHDIPVATIVRRFTRSWSNFENLYRPVVDRWSIYDGESHRQLGTGSR